MWADCLHFFGQDVREMDGGEAVTLAAMIWNYVPVDPSGRALSACAQFWQAKNKAVDSEHVMNDAEIAALVAQGA